MERTGVRGGKLAAPWASFDPASPVERATDASRWPSKQTQLEPGDAALGPGVGSGAVARAAALDRMRDARTMAVRGNDVDLVAAVPQVPGKMSCAVLETPLTVALEGV